MAKITKARRDAVLKATPAIQAAATRVGRAAEEEYLTAKSAVITEFENQNSALINGHQGFIPEDDHLRAFVKAEAARDEVLADAKAVRQTAAQDVVDRYIQIKDEIENASDEPEETDEEDAPESEE